MRTTKQALRIHGILFVGIVFFVALASLVLPRLSERTEQIVLALLILLLGVPHGALDTAFAQRFYQVKGIKGWIAFGILYLLLASLVVGVWVVAPLLYLIFFLTISLIHFADDPIEGTKSLSRLLYGGAILVLPVLFHAEEVSRLFGFLVGVDAARIVVSGLIFLAVPWLIGLIVAALYEIGNNKQLLTGFEYIAIGTLALIAPPLIAFTVFFCAMHSARHVLRTIIWMEQEPYHVLRRGLLPMIALCLMGWVASILFHNKDFDSKIIQIIFVGLAALTVPHMIILSRVKFRREETIKL
jgi:beta-carotene 15,15'-dioxygenase